MMVRKRPIPTLVASLIDRGMTRASHWRKPKNAKPKKTNPSTNVAVRAMLYGVVPEPWKPTMLYAK